MQATDLIADGLRGFGEKKLLKLDVEILREIVCLLGDEGKKDSGKEDLVRILLRKKRNKEIVLSVTKREFSSSPKVQTNCEVFSIRRSLEIISFNSLKLRVFRDNLKERFHQLARRFAMADIVVFSEVNDVSRSNEFLKYLQEHGEWSVETSCPSPPLNEVHAVFVKAPFKVMHKVTTVSVGSTPLSHAPFSVLIRHDMFGRFVVSSVHFPPQNKAVERDTQIKAFVNAYVTESQLRCNTPFTKKGALDAKTSLPVHVICGDFNCWPGDKAYELDRVGFDVVLGKNVTTTSGMRAFDNMLITGNAKDNFCISSSVLELAQPQRSCKGELGLSDHHPISLRLESCMRRLSASTENKQSVALQCSSTFTKL